jgi:hypothetical protein
MKDSYLLSFFFKARDEDIEKLMIGTYKSLQKQLFKQIPALHIDFDSLDQLVSKLCSNHKWNIKSLKVLLAQAMRALGEASIVCSIHALDECEEDLTRDMIHFFEKIWELALLNRFAFNSVCQGDVIHTSRPRQGSL